MYWISYVQVVNLEACPGPNTVLTGLILNKELDNQLKDLEFDLNSVLTSRFNKLGNKTCKLAFQQSTQHTQATYNKKKKKNDHKKI